VGFIPTLPLGNQNTNADALSRIGSVRKEDDRSDEFDEDRKRQILYEFHDSPVDDHRGMNKPYRAIKSQYSWPNMRCGVEEYVKQCLSTMQQQYPSTIQQMELLVGAHNR
jgi:hypothetical protein